MQASVVGGQPLGDNLVQRLLSSTTDQKLNEKILETPKLDGKYKMRLREGAELPTFKSSYYAKDAANTK